MPPDEGAGQVATSDPFAGDAVATGVPGTVNARPWREPAALVPTAFVAVTRRV